jgi:hypothetical protein
MSVLGPESAKQFLRKLDEKKLLDLCADILAIEGHTEIKITDGTGDGQRDIHSMTPNNEKHLAQSKYHGNISRAVSAPEIGEVISGMLRFGYKRGLFITTARITPQAKRDLLESYPGFEVDFLEGKDIVKKVFSNLILKAIWYDGTSLDKVPYTLVVPVVARDLESDKPLPILSHRQNSIQGSILNVGRTQVQSLLRRSTVNTSVFGQYRSPRVRTVSELGSSQISLTEVILSGIIYLEDIADVLQTVGNEIVDRIKRIYPTKQHFAIMVGYPCLTPLGGEASGARIQLDKYEAITLVYHGKIIENELDWILPTQEAGWYLPDRASASQAEWIRWYNPRIDVCLDIKVASPPSDATKWMIDEQKEFFTKWWKESLFVLLPTHLQSSWEDTNLPQPSQWYQWNIEKSLAMWIHPYLSFPLRIAQIESDYEPLKPFPLGPDPEQVRKELSDLLQQLENLGGAAVEPIKARYMIGLVDEDPFPTQEVVIYQGKDLILGEKVVPSPIDPLSRGIEFIVCWLTKPISNDSVDSESELIGLTDELSRRDYFPFKVTIRLDDSTLSKETFLLAYIDYIPSVGFEKTQSLLNGLDQLLESVLLKLEADLRSRFVIHRATGEYWDKEILMKFGSD